MVILAFGFDYQKIKSRRVYFATMAFL